MKLNSILELISKRKGTAAEFQQAHDALDVASVEAAVDALEAERQALLLKDGADTQIEALEAKIRDGNREVERVHAAKAALQRLRQEATNREQAAALDKRAATARAVQRSMLLQLVDLDLAVTKVCELLDKLEAGRREIREANRFVVEQGRSDLKCPFPEYVLAEHVGLSTPESLPRFWTWTLDGYRQRSGELGDRSPVRSELRLSRAKELIE